MSVSIFCQRNTRGKKLGERMPGLQSIDSNIDRWANISYGVTALYFIVILIACQFEVKSWHMLYDPVLNFLLFLFIHQKMSRVVAFVLVISSVISGVENTSMLIETDALIFGVGLLNDIDAYLVVFDATFAFLGLMLGMNAQKFHMSVDSHYNIRNFLIRTLITFSYVIAGSIIFVLIEAFFSELSETMGEIYRLMAVSVVTAIFFLGIWKKLPGTDRFPVFIWGDEKPMQSKSAFIGRSQISNNAMAVKRQDCNLTRILFAMASTPFVGTKTYAVVATLTGPLLLYPILQIPTSTDFDLNLWQLVFITVIGLFMSATGIGNFYARHAFKKRHNCSLTAKALAELEGLN